MAKYKGSESFLTSQPFRVSETTSSPAAAVSATPASPSTALPDSPATVSAVSAVSSDVSLPGGPAAKKRRLEEGDMDDDTGEEDEQDQPFIVPENNAAIDWERAFREGRLGYLKLKDDLLATKGYLIAKDTKLMDSHSKYYQLEGLLVQAKQESIKANQEVNRVKEVVNQRDKTINELEFDIQSLKITVTDMTTVYDHLLQTIASNPAEQSQAVPNYIPSLNPAVRDRVNYVHADAPRKGQKSYRGFQATLPYASGNGKAAPSKYGSNANWDLGLCHAHFQTPQACEHGDACEYRHCPLNQNERQYMGFLTKGKDFLRRLDEVSIRKTPA